MRPRLFYLTVLVVVIADQVSKRVALAELPWNVKEPVVPHVLWLTLTRNTGGAFSLFQANNRVFIAIASVAILALVYAYQRSARRELVPTAAMALALGGAIGNVIDRIRLDAVVDFFDLGWWPVFNVADSAISIAIVLLAWHFLFGSRTAEGERGRGGEGENPEAQPSTLNPQLANSPTNTPAQD